MARTRSISAAVSRPRRRWSSRRSGGFASAFAVIAFSLLVIGGFGCARHNAAGADRAVVRISQRNEPTDLDPATASLPDEFFIIRAVSEGLLVPNPPGGEPLPGAAERFDVSADGLTYTFYLRPGALWSNGEPVVADDFVASYRRVLSPATGAPKAYLFYAVKNARAYVTDIVKDFSKVGITAPDKMTLVVSLEHANPAFPKYVASGPWIPVNPRAVAEHGRQWTSPQNYVGNGPFVLTEWRSHQRIVVRKNPKYFDADHVRADAIQFVRFDNPDSEERAFRAGDIDITMSLPQAKIDVYAREHPEDLHRAPLAETRFIAFNVSRAPLNDSRVRRALSLALDREKLVTLVLRGGQQPAERFLSPALLSGADSVAAGAGPEGGASRQDWMHRHDRETARRLLAEAGYPDGKGFPHLELSGWDRNPVLEAIQQLWKRELGIDVALTVREAKVHLAALASGDYDLAFATNLLDVRDPTAALHDFTSGASNNFPHWQSAEFDRRIEAASHAASTKEALVEDFAAEQLLLTDAPVAPIYFNAQNWLMSPSVHGWEQDALWTRRYDDLWVAR